MRLGFTGTREGMTDLQKETVQRLMVGAAQFHHGDCVGADEEAWVIARSLGIWTVGHPPTKQNHRAFTDNDELRPPHPYLQRDLNIVEETVALVAASIETFEGPLPKFRKRSGTFYTVRYAVSLNRPTVIVNPDGSTAGFGHYNITKRWRDGIGLPTYAAPPRT